MLTATTHPDGVVAVQTGDGMDFYGACSTHRRCSRAFSAPRCADDKDGRGFRWASDSARRWLCPECEAAFTKLADGLAYAALEAESGRL